MEKETLKRIILDQYALQSPPNLIQRTLWSSLVQHLDNPHAIIMTGVRRCGKSTLMRQLRQAYCPDAYYLNFDDERLLSFTVDDFNVLYEAFIELFDLQKTFFLDEIQNIPNWEAFVRRMQDKGFKFFLTGSNATLLSQELATRLTGRNIVFTVYPFSFTEFLVFNKFEVTPHTFLSTDENAQLQRLFHIYLAKGGMPEYLEYKDNLILKNLYENILYRDVVTRYDIKDVAALRELSLYLMSNISRTYSYHNLKNILQLGSVNTVKNYIQYMENCYLFFSTNRFTYSVKQQQRANRKIYSIDNGVADSVGFKFSNNTGWFLENLVFLELKRRNEEIYYYKTETGLEVDFVLRKNLKITKLIQVTQSLQDKNVRERELRALVGAMQETKCESSLILTLNEESVSVFSAVEKSKIAVQPIYRWLLDMVEEKNEE